MCQHALVGNGGFSLRSKKLQTYLKNSTSEITENEDVIICQLRRSELEKQGFKYAPLDIATKFSWEWAGNPGRAFGQHGHSGKIKALRQRWLNAYRATQLLRRLVSLNTP
ncbi:DUF5672 family protein [Undibacterium sp. RuRC25W]|uniref:DUF5672 family protein n=1 Tax=Undibacterium sp. RuRC25W TaxID=3413047 RepID=UPI003BF0BB0C